MCSVRASQFYDSPGINTITIEHYFEMSKIDAKDALAIYRHFCKQTERVVEYLGVARKLQNLLNVPIPNLRHVSHLNSRRVECTYLYVSGTCLISRLLGRVP